MLSINQKIIKYLIIKCILILIMFSNKAIDCQKLFTKLLPNEYNREIAPKVNGNAVNVNVSVNILSILPEQDIKMAFNVDIFYHLYWEDHRLRSIDGMPENLTLGSEWKNHLWVPDTYFRNAMTGGVADDVLSPSNYFIITNRIKVFMAARLRMKLSCNMKFNKFPFDRQLCFINITTLSQNLKEVQLNWHTFRVGNHVELPEYKISGETKGVCTKNFKSIGNFSCIYVALNFNRNVGNYLIKRFIPSFLIVLMSFVGFWIPTSIAPARVSLIITSLLALIAQQIQSELNVSYVYALQVWTILCIVFVFATLLEYAIAISWPFIPKTDDQQNTIEKQVNNRFLCLRASPRNCIVDIVSRIVFPISFFAALIIFGLTYYSIDFN